ncbi:MAG: hypothetical protein QME81_15380 [bacterium]|nr:hypothetical protein [bacterium]
MENIVVVAGQDSPNHDVVLTPKPARGSISGIVSPASSEAIVTFYKAGEIIDFVYINPTDGSYSNSFSEAGIYSVEVTAEKGYLRDISLKEIEVVAGKDSSGNNVTLVKPPLPVGSSSLVIDRSPKYFSLKEGEIGPLPPSDLAFERESIDSLIVKINTAIVAGDTVAEIIDLGPICMMEVTTVPLNGYVKEIPITEKHSYAMRTSDGHYEVIYITHLVLKEGSLFHGNYVILYFDWVYQPNGTRVFYW